MFIGCVFGVYGWLWFWYCGVCWLVLVCVVIDCWSLLSDLIVCLLVIDGCVTGLVWVCFGGRGVVCNGLIVGFGLVGLWCY